MRVGLGHCDSCANPAACARGEEVGLDLAEPGPGPRCGVCAPPHTAVGHGHPREVRQLCDDRGAHFVCVRNGYVAEKNGFPIRTSRYVNHVPDRVDKPPRWVNWGGSVRTI